MSNSCYLFQHILLFTYYLFYILLYKIWHFFPTRSWLFTNLYFREGAIILPFKRPRYTPPIQPTQTAQPASKRARIQSASATGPSPNSVMKYSVDCENKLFRTLAEKFHSNSRNLLSLAYSASTWRSYESAWNCYKNFELDTSEKSQWPISQTCLNNFITWCMYEKKLMASSIQSYVHSLCSIHQLMGHDSLIFSSLVTKAIIRGTENLETSKLSM